MKVRFLTLRSVGFVPGELCLDPVGRLIHSKDSSAPQVFAGVFTGPSPRRPSPRTCSRRTGLTFAPPSNRVGAGGGRKDKAGVIRVRRIHPPAESFATSCWGSCDKWQSCRFNSSGVSSTCHTQFSSPPPPSHRHRPPSADCGCTEKWDVPSKLTFAFIVPEPGYV